MTYSEREFGASQSDYPKEQQMSDIVERLEELSKRLMDEPDRAEPMAAKLVWDAAQRLRAGRAADPEAVEAAKRLLKHYPNEEDDENIAATALLASASSPDSSRADVVEECAKVVETLDFVYPPSRPVFAAAIRALKGGAA